MLLCIPKNLVYVFVLAILSAFLGMLYLTYFVTEEEMKEFMRYDRSQEVVTVDPVLASMIEYMRLDMHTVPEKDIKECDERVFFDDYLSENRPVVLREYAKEWIAMNKWSDLGASFRSGARLTVAPIARLYPTCSFCPGTFRASPIPRRATARREAHQKVWTGEANK